MKAALAMPELANDYVAVGQAIGHDFQHGRALADIVGEARRSGAPQRIPDWTA